jgi:hypothetical protein
MENIMKPYVDPEDPFSKIEDDENSDIPNAIKWMEENSASINEYELNLFKENNKKDIDNLNS